MALDPSPLADTSPADAVAPIHTLAPASAVGPSGADSNSAQASERRRSTSAKSHAVRAPPSTATGTAGTAAAAVQTAAAGAATADAVSDSRRALVGIAAGASARLAQAARPAPASAVDPPGADSNSVQAPWRRLSNSAKPSPALCLAVLSAASRRCSELLALTPAAASAVEPSCADSNCAQAWARRRSVSARRSASPAPGAAMDGGPSTRVSVRTAGGSTSAIDGLGAALEAFSLAGACTPGADSNSTQTSRRCRITAARSPSLRATDAVAARTTSAPPAAAPPAPPLPPRTGGVKAVSGGCSAAAMARPRDASRAAAGFLRGA